MKYNYLVEGNNGEIHPASFFYFYPIEIDDYVSFYKNHNDKAYPVMAFIYLTHQCGDRCPGCFVNNIYERDATLNKSVLKDLLTDLAEGGALSVKFAGREPTSSKHLGYALKTSYQLGMKSLVITSAAKIDQHADEIAQYCTHLRISLNTISEERHALLHYPKDDSLKFNDRIKYTREILKKRRDLKLVSGATFLVRGTTIDETIEFAKMCKELGFDYIRYTVLDQDQGKYPERWLQIYYKLLTFENKKFDIYMDEAIDYPVSYRTDNIPTNLFDPALISRVTIHATGDVSSCQEGWRADWPKEKMAFYGNLHEESFSEIWNGHKRKDFLKFIRTYIRKENGNPPGCKNCKYNEFNYIHRWIIKKINSTQNTIFKKKYWNSFYS